MSSPFLQYPTATYGSASPSMRQVSRSGRLTRAPSPLRLTSSASPPAFQPPRRHATVPPPMVRNEPWDMDDEQGGHESAEPIHFHTPYEAQRAYLISYLRAYYDGNSSFESTVYQYFEQLRLSHGFELPLWPITEMTPSNHVLRLLKTDFAQFVAEQSQRLGVPRPQGVMIGTGAVTRFVVDRRRSVEKCMSGLLSHQHIERMSREKCEQLLDSVQMGNQPPTMQVSMAYSSWRGHF